jgi:hypothetical protein
MRYTFCSTFPLPVQNHTHLLCPSLPFYADIQGTDTPNRSEQAHHGNENDNWLSEACKKWIVVGDDQFAFAEIIHKIDSRECEHCSTCRIHECSMKRGGCANEGNCGTVLNISGTVSVCKICCSEKTYSAPSGRITRSSTCSYSTPSGCFGPSRNGTLSTYPLPVLSFRRNFFRSALHPTRKG